jgi:ribosomal protein S18 acetylase RimI-like enzyme
VRRAVGPGIEIDDDPARVDLAEVYRFLSDESYWARGRSRARIEQAVHASARVVGLYEGERQVGFARVVSDGGIAYLADVYVLAELRGRGLGKVLVTEAVEGGPFADCRWLLHTQDAHELYRRLGFSEPDDPTLMQRPAGDATRRPRGASAS